MIVHTLQLIEGKALTQELKVAVPSVEGVTVRVGEVEIRRLTGDFDAAEQVLIQTVLAAHDALAIQADRQAVLDEKRTNALATLKLPQIDAFIDTQIAAITNLADAKQFLRRFCKTVARYIRAREGGG